MLLSAFDRTENVMENGENTGYQHFLLSHYVFKSHLLHGRESSLTLSQTSPGFYVSAVQVF